MIWAGPPEKLINDLYRVDTFGTGSSQSISLPAAVRVVSVPAGVSGALLASTVFDLEQRVILTQSQRYGTGYNILHVQYSVV